MPLTDTIRRAPRWAWVTAGGIGLGAAGIKLWNNRAKPAGEATATAQEIGDPSSPYPVPQSTGNPVATIVPPVIIANQGEDPSASVAPLLDLFTSTILSAQQMYADVWGPVQTSQLMLLQGNAQTIQDLAMAGAAPGGASMPPALEPYIPPAPVAPVALPAAQPAPVAAPVIRPDPCTGEYPNESGGECYKIACASGRGDLRAGRWHFHKSGRKVWVRATC